MSLSEACLNQHAKEDVIAQKWLLRGLLVAVGAHLALIPLMSFIPAEVIDPPERIALVVTGPTDPLETTENPIEEVPPEESVEALTEAVAQAELAAEAQLSGGSPSSTPPPVAAFRPEPQPADLAEPPPVESDSPAEPEDPEAEKPPLDPEIEDSVETSEEPAAETEAEELEETSKSETSDLEAELESDSTENEPEPVETAANSTGEAAIPDLDTSDLDALRARLRRAREREGTSTDTGDMPSAPTEAGTETARRTGPSESSGAGTAAGDGDGDSSGPNTVGCRRCDRPEYPEEALEAGAEGAPLVNLEYDESGRVVNVVLQRSSGNAALDRAAMEAARDYELDSGGRSGSVPLEMDFGIEGSQRSRAARQRGERESINRPEPAQAQEQEVVKEPTPEQESQSPVAGTAPVPTGTPDLNRTEESMTAPLSPEPLSPELEQPPAPETTPAPEVSIPPAPEPAPPIPDIAPPPEPAPLPESVSPPSPKPALAPPSTPEPAPIPEIGLPE